jgi:hypothetical protein
MAEWHRLMLNFVTGQPHFLETDDKRVVYIRSRLEGIAARTAEQWERRHENTPFSWKDYLNAIRSAYADPAAKQKAIREIQTLHQAPREDITHFATRFRDVGFRTTWDDATLLDLFKERIAYSCATAMAGNPHQPSTLEEYIIAVTELEGRLQQAEIAAAPISRPGVPTGAGGTGGGTGRKEDFRRVPGA